MRNVDDTAHAIGVGSADAGGVVSDPVLAAWLRSEVPDAQALAARSDILEVLPLGPNRLLARFDCNTLIGSPERGLSVGGPVVAQLNILPGHLHGPDPFEVVSILAPLDIWLPNVRADLCCIGPIERGARLRDLLHRVYEVLTGQNCMPDERDALNLGACEWARQHADRFPVDARPLLRPRPRPLEGEGKGNGKGEGDVRLEGPA